VPFRICAGAVKFEQAPARRPLKPRSPEVATPLEVNQASPQAGLGNRILKVVGKDRLAKLHELGVDPSPVTRITGRPAR
jgi:hypothetical protein